MKRLVAALATLVAVFAIGASSAHADWIRPRIGQQFYWQLSGDLPFDLPVPPGGFLPERYWPYLFFDLDGFDHGTNTPQSDFLSLQYAAKVPTCYISAGTYESWRPDASQFPSSVLGRTNGWPGERWLDIRSQAVRDIMRARIVNTCRDALGVEFDNQDGYTNSTGFPLTARDQLAYNQWLADTAHAANKFAILKNDVDQLAALEPYYDMALNEQCAQYSECGGYSAFTSRGKLVVQVEYRSSVNSNWCNAALAGNRMLYFADLDLTGQWIPCPTQPAFQPTSTPPPSGPGEVTPEQPTDPAPEQPKGAGHPSPGHPKKAKVCKGKRGRALRKCKRKYRKKAHI